VFHNDYEGARLSDDDIAVAELLNRMGTWARDNGAPSYPLAFACQDHLVGLAIGGSASTDRTVTTGREAWAE
jgi:hypothetical protein